MEVLVTLPTRLRHIGHSQHHCHARRVTQVYHESKSICQSKSPATVSLYLPRRSVSMIACELYAAGAHLKLAFPESLTGQSEVEDLNVSRCR